MTARVYGSLRPAEAPQGKETRSATPFRRIPLAEVQPFQNSIPALDLKLAAGQFTATQTDPSHYEWVAPQGRTRPAPGLFLAQVIGESMNRRIPNGAWCIWRFQPGGSRQGKIVLAQHREIADPENGGQYTVKVYSSQKIEKDGSWEHQSVTLSPDSTDAVFAPLTFDKAALGSLTIVAELLEVLG